MRACTRPDRRCLDARDFHRALQRGQTCQKELDERFHPRHIFHRLPREEIKAECGVWYVETLNQAGVPRRVMRRIHPVSLWVPIAVFVLQNVFNFLIVPSAAWSGFAAWLIQ